MAGGARQVPPVYTRWRAHPEGRGDEEDRIWICDPDRVWRALGAVLGDPPERVLALRLRRLGLPETPATMRHFRAVVAGRSEPLPARGVLVTTKVVTQGREAERDGVEGLELFDLSTIPTLGNLEHVPGPLLDQATAVIAKHRRWCQEHVERLFGPNPLTDLAAIRAAQPTAFVAQGDQQRSPHPVDYYVEALNGLGTLLTTLAVAASTGENREGAITRYLEETYHRVHAGHRRAYETARKRGPVPDAVIPPPQPPVGWRDDIRAYVARVDDQMLEMVREMGGVPPELTAWLKQRAARLAARARISPVTPLGGPCV